MTVGSVDTVHVIDQTLGASAPVFDASLWRPSSNVMRLTFGVDIALPVAGTDIELRELLPNGAFGPELLAARAFTLTVELDAGSPRILRIAESGDVLNHRSWYGISSAGWGGLTPFKVHHVVQAGDATGDGLVLFNDLSTINTDVPSFGVGDDHRKDISGDGNILFNDLSEANASIPSFAVTKPTGHECE